MAKRIQRKRTKGWRMPEGAVYVGRPTRWGNPYPVNVFGLDDALKLFRETLQGFWSPSNVAHMDLETAGLAYKLHDDFRKRFNHHPLDCIGELRGKDLACWCPLDQKCHADILIEFASEGE